MLSNERAPSGELLHLDGRIIGFTYEDAERHADKVSLQLDHFDLALFDREELTGGATLAVSWGYPGNMAPPRQVVVKKLKDFQTLTIEGQATSVLMNREAKTRAWTNKSRSAVAKEIAVESDLSRRTGRVELRGRDALTKATLGSRASSSTVERATLTDVLEVVDPETGSSSLQERNATTSAHPTAAPTPTAAERESAARFRPAERETVKLSMQVVGAPTLRAKAVLEVRGFSYCSRASIC